MERRNLLKLLAVVGLGASGGAASLARASAQAQGAGEGAGKPIVLYCDLAIDPAREEEMLQAFHTRFRPAAESFRGRGFIDLKMLKLRTVIQGGPAPAPGINYRFQLTYESEEQRQVWVQSDLHQEVWPLIEDTVLNKDYLVLLTDAV
jgi:heme-degrading monooxygenase HmoA